MERKVLGKGLEALIPKRKEEKEKTLLYLSVEKIEPSPFQPRQEMDAQELEELKASIREKGVIQPIIVRKVGERFELVAGSRRVQAAKSLGIKELPAVVREITDKESLILALIENLQRKNLNPIEEALAFKRLNEEFALTYEEIARLMGKDKTSISNNIRLLKLPQEIQEALKKNIITFTQARALLGLEREEEQKALFYRIIKERLSVREIEERVRRHFPKKPKKKVEDPFVEEVEERLRKSLGTKVKVLHKRNNQGKIIIQYYNLTDLQRIVEKLS
ncbi:MAG: ParB/RepB/Spo0J family partition protein [Candidatus Omnitrophica bacterium]|nr:ParB/RepB/Spo0J family partition protein [Candidatus Omnitrophota bacterium]